MVFGEQHIDKNDKPNYQTSGGPSYVYTHERKEAQKKAPEKRAAIDINAPKANSLEWEKTGLKLGDPAGENDFFCPWRLVTGYTDMFVGKANGELARPLFELGALHENRVWDLYYIHRPDAPHKDPLLFVPTYQFEHLLDTVNNKLGIYLNIPGGANNKKFRHAFGLGDTPRPRFLGRSTSEEVFHDLTEDYPPIHSDDNLAKATDLGREFFIEYLQSIMAIHNKKKGKASKSRKRLKVHREWGHSTKRVQRYLGLRQSNGIANTAQVTASGAQTVDLGRPMDIKPEDSVRFVAIDIEAYEHNHDLITEVGVAVLDTDKLVGVGPGEAGKNWFPLIDAHHFRVDEARWAVNRDHVHGCPDWFNFGDSEFVPRDMIPSMLEKIINQAEAKPGETAIGGRRPVVLVFHESAADIKYLDVLGYSIYRATNVLEIADTRHMDSFNRRTNNPNALEKILGRLGVHCQNLHNAGNDAVYTLQAMIALAIERRLYSLASRVGEETSSHIPFEEFRSGEGWESGGEDSDGGEPVPPVPDFAGSAYQGNW
ncbi:hypothetical protein B0T16DRAFT_328729 [Cercophora newfieldiana]|uniref:Gfd2/YDR514C-like C-terminal domain-containing protein n=1 Tax=Cercophora newfieldiana TaxID=92897 RepID=A0AA39Y6G2_9PEZI|nr:hypothetical protein B0T16DRAFT_328729 [Cercophora newfieldiana]